MNLLYKCSGGGGGGGPEAPQSSSPPTPPSECRDTGTWLKPFSTQAITDGVIVFKQLVGYILFEMTISQLYVPCSSVVALID